MDDEGASFVIGFLVGILFFAISMFLFYSFTDYVDIKESTLTDICINLTNNSASIGKTEDGKLVCELPSYDHVSTIIIRDNSEASR